MYFTHIRGYISCLICPFTQNSSLTGIICDVIGEKIIFPYNVMMQLLHMGDHGPGRMLYLSKVLHNKCLWIWQQELVKLLLQTLERLSDKYCVHFLKDKKYIVILLHNCFWKSLLNAFSCTSETFKYQQLPAGSNKSVTKVEQEGTMVSSCSYAYYN